MTNYSKSDLTVKSFVDEALSDQSPKDRPWDIHRAQADLVQAIYENSRDNEMERLGRRVLSCSDVLTFTRQADDEGVVGLKLARAEFCRVRHCPVCQWRRSLMWQARFYDKLPEILAQQRTGLRWIFLTLTVRNCSIENLRSTIQEMNKSWKRLIQRKRFSDVKGWIRTTEVTRGQDGSAHPHFHCLLLVSPSMLSGKSYVPHAEWVALWQKTLRANYSPNVDVRTVKPRRGEDRESALKRSVKETLKYAVKPRDMVSDKGWFLELTRQVDRLRFIATGGVLKDILKEDVPETNDDLMLRGKAEEQEQESSEDDILFNWRKREKKYRRKYK